MTAPLYLPALGLATPIGVGKAEVAAALFAGSSGLRPHHSLPAHVGPVTAALPTIAAALAHLDSRNNRLLLAALEQIAGEVAAAAARFGADRVAVVLGTSTSGIAEGEAAVGERLRSGAWPKGYDYRHQEAGSPAEFAARALGLAGPAYVVATACSSSAKVFASARRLIRAGLCDAAVVGGADTLCAMTLAGFSALESVSRAPCNPMSRNRDGISIGEAAAVFLMQREPAGIALLGVGETSDAHHVSAPDPEGKGAMAAMRLALADAGLDAADIAYVNLHGTATPLNDAMESKAVHALFGDIVPASSTKALTGHTLGAAGAVEAAFLWLTLSPAFNPGNRLPPHVWDCEADPALPPLRLAGTGDRLPTGDRVAALSNSFAFGGSNCTLVLGRGW